MAFGPGGLALEAWADSSLANADGGRSLGGWCIKVAGSGALIAGASAPAAAAESSGVAELHQIVLTVKAVLGARIFMRELNVAPTGPTPLRTDAQVVVDAVKSLRVSPESKWVAPRYAMVRKAVSDGAVTIEKVDTRDNCADIFTKPLVGAVFLAHRATVLGLRETFPPG